LVFFVLSGFLITGILLAAKGSPRLLPEFLRRGAAAHLSRLLRFSSSSLSS
jgi:peptidoglycan/LPS O-acetylase OafA/YrhL